MANISCASRTRILPTIPFLNFLLLCLLVLSSTTLFLLTAAHSDGADSAACGTGSSNGFPSGHGGNFQTSAAPYSLTAANSATTYSPGVPLVLTLQATTSATFAGFMLQGFSASDTNFATRLGSFAATGSTNANNVHTICTNGNAITHSNSNGKTSVTLSYTPPAAGASAPSSLIVYATVVQSLTVFWKISLTLTQASGQAAAPENPSALFVRQSVVDQTTGTDTLTFEFTSPSTQVNLDYFIIEASTGGVAGLVDIKHLSVVAGQATYTFSLANLTASTAYLFRVRSHNQAGLSGATTSGTNSVSVTTGSKSGVQPITPTISTSLPSPLSQPSAGTIQLNLASFIAQQPSSSGLLGFDIQYRKASNSVYGSNVVYVRANQQQVSITDLTADTYFFHIRAYGTSGTSAYSSDFSSSITSLCLNDCGGSTRGVCMTKDKVCNCNVGYVGFDCSIPSMLSTTTSTDKGKCFGSSCSWRMDYGLIGNISAPTHVMFRITVKSPGYNGMLFDASDGMSGGIGYYTDYQGAPGQVSLQTIYASRKDTPESTTADMYAMSHIQAWQEDDRITTEYLFMKDISSTSAAPIIQYTTDDSKTQYLSWAWGETSARVQHSKSASGRFTIQWSTGKIVIIDDMLLLRAYAPMIVCFFLVLIIGAILRISSIRNSSVGNFLLQKQVDTNKGNFIPTWIHTLTLNTLSTISDFLYVEVGLIMLYLLCFILFIILGGADFNDVGKQRDLIWAHAAAMHWAFVLFPVNKNSILNWILGTTFERMVKYHRFLARLALAYTYVHGITRLVDEGWIIITDRPGIRWGLYALIAFTITIGVAFEPIRRKYWNIFLLSHIVFAPLGILFAILHVNYMLWFMPLPVALWLGDVILRVFVRPSVLYSTTTVEAKLLLPDEAEKTLDYATYGMVSKLTLDVKGFPKAGQFEPGSYCFLNIPHISLTQWHPFSISSYPQIDGGGGAMNESTRLTFHIMDMGRNWTHDLAQHLANPSSSALAVKVDGPYGRLQLDLTRYHTLILVGGGIGITPLLSILDFLTQKLSSSDPDYSSLTTIHLIWSSQKHHAFQLYAPELMKRLRGGGRVGKSVKLYLFSTQRKAGEELNGGGQRMMEMETIQQNGEMNGGQRTVHVATASDSPEEHADNVIDDSSESITHGRPPLSTLFQTIAQSLAPASPSHRDVEDGLVASQSAVVAHTPASVGVLSCGPQSMVDEAQHQARLHGFHWHKETFRL